jgi:hypothetical protein
MPFRSDLTWARLVRAISVTTRYERGAGPLQARDKGRGIASTLMAVDPYTLVSARSRSPLTATHLSRLSEIAEADHAFFTRDAGNWTDYRDQRVLVLLTQGGALHYLDGKSGVKDLDLWTFYAANPGHSIAQLGQRHRAVDFGLSEFGRQLYRLDVAKDARQRAQWQKWSQYTGRRVDLFVRDLPVAPTATYGAALAAVRAWLADGIREGSRRPSKARKPSGWHLAHKPAIVIDPPEHRDETAWGSMLP